MLPQMSPFPTKANASNHFHMEAFQFGGILLRGENDICTYSYLFNLYNAMSPYMTEDLHV